MEVEDILEEEVLETEEVKMTPGAKALMEYRKNLTPEEKKHNIEKARETRKENQNKKKEIQTAMEYLLNKRYMMRDSNGETIFCTGYDLRAKALFEAAINPDSKNQLGAEKLIRETMDENVEDNSASNSITVVFQKGQEFDV